MKFYIYIITNKKNGVLYLGFTNSLKRRMQQHKRKYGNGFAAKYKLDRLVYYEKFSFPLSGIKREKQLKKWEREWKINLINDLNPDWEDLTYFFD